MYYQNDPEFFSNVIGQETAPFNFKIHLFYNSGSEGTIEPREQRTKMMQFLDTFGAVDVDMKPIPDRKGNKEHEKLRVLFAINDQGQAQSLYDMVGLHR